MSHTRTDPATLRALAACVVYHFLIALSAVLVFPAMLGVVDAWFWVVFDTTVTSINWPLPSKLGSALASTVLGLLVLYIATTEFGDD